jgi:hypothetical protein
MKQVLELVIQDKNVQKDIAQELKEYNSASLATQAKLGKVYCHRAKSYENAMNIMGDVIYDKTCENNDLREQIGNVDEEIIRRKLNDSKLKSNEQKNNVIRINKTQKTKCNL